MGVLDFKESSWGFLWGLGFLFEGFRVQGSFEDFRISGSIKGSCRGSARGSVVGFMSLAQSVLGSLACRD